MFVPKGRKLAGSADKMNEKIQTNVGQVRYATSHNSYTSY